MLISRIMVRPIRVARTQRSKIASAIGGNVVRTTYVGKYQVILDIGQRSFVSATEYPSYTSAVRAARDLEKKVEKSKCKS